MPRRVILGWIGIACWIAIASVREGFIQGASQESSRSALQFSPPRSVLDRYCVTCHSEKQKTAGLLLEKIDVENVPAGAEVWEKVIRKLRTGAMPPAGMPRPDNATYDSLATYLETTLDHAAEARPDPGRPALRRLNRAEYTNAVRDLLAMDVGAADIKSLLPADESAYGFNNIADVLSVSPLLLERYLSAAKKISRLAIGDPAVRPFFQDYTLSQSLLQDARMSEDLPFGSRGGFAIRHYFPLDGEYLLKVSLQSNKGGTIRGLAEPHQLDIRLDGSRIKLLTVGGKKKSAPQQEGDNFAAADPKEEIEVRFPAKAGPALVAVTFMQQSFVREGALQPLGSKTESLPRLAQRDIDNYAGGDPAVDSISIGGPYNAQGTGDTPSRRKILVCHPTGREDEELCARKILSTLARRAYRGPVADEDVQDLFSLYKTGQSKGFEAGIEMALRGILVNPGFLFRIERDPQNVAPGAAYRISDLELASRLSFFLWSSMPDDQLLALAEQGKLKDAAVLEQQVRRMLADARSNALVSNFAEEWLSVRNLSSVMPDPDAFPDFDGNLREAFQRETELFFESIVRDDHSALDLLNADYTFLNERLARHYGIPNIYGNEFRRVTLNNNEERRGLLGQGSILMVTSYANRTAPVLRGKWILENILGTPPPPPPPNVPALKENSETKAFTMRQRMEQHRANPACATCHKLMDPLGFGLEKFDAIGRWRTTEGNNSRIDASGVLVDGTKFDGPAELRQTLLSHPEQFVNTLTEKLLTYALGRGLEYYDVPAVRKVVREAAPGNYRWSQLILSVVKSTPFQMRRSQRS